jgi:predicted nucleic acid-binding protein
VYLIDTNVVSELRKRGRADRGVVDFFDQASAQGDVLYLSVISVGELRRGVELIRYRGDAVQAQALETWLAELLQDFSDRVLPFDADAAQTWGRLRVPNAHHEIDKQIAAIAWVHDLTVVTRNTGDFLGTGVRLLNPFAVA